MKKKEQLKRKLLFLSKKSLAEDAKDAVEGAIEGYIHQKTKNKTKR